MLSRLEETEEHYCQKFFVHNHFSSSLLKKKGIKSNEEDELCQV